MTVCVKIDNAAVFNFIRFYELRHSPTDGRRRGFSRTLLLLVEVMVCFRAGEGG